MRQLFRTTDDRAPRGRLQIIPLAARGRPHQDIAAGRGVAPRTAPRWLNACLDRGPDGLAPRKAKGAAPSLAAEVAPLLRRWVIEGPAAQGLDRASWTDAELADHLYQTRGVRARESAVREFCHRHDIRPYRPTCRFLRGDPAKQAAARDDLAGLKRKRGPANSSC